MNVSKCTHLIIGIALCIAISATKTKAETETAQIPTSQITMELENSPILELLKNEQTIPCKPITWIETENCTAPEKSQEPIEPEKLEYLRSIIHPNPKHQRIAKYAAILTGYYLRTAYARKVRMDINQGIENIFQGGKSRINKRKLFLWTLKGGAFFVKYGLDTMIWISSFLLNAEKNGYLYTPKLDYPGIENILLALGDSICASKIQSLLLDPKDNDRLIAGMGGSVAALLYGAYYQLLFSNRACLARTVADFKSTPENFPRCAFYILKKAETHFETMSKKDIALACVQLRELCQNPIKLGYINT